MCGETCAVSPARSAAVWMMSHALWRDSGAPRTPRNSRGVALPFAAQPGAPGSGRRRRRRGRRTRPGRSVPSRPSRAPAARRRALCRRRRAARSPTRARPWRTAVPAGHGRGRPTGRPPWRPPTRAWGPRHPGAARPERSTAPWGAGEAPSGAQPPARVVVGTPFAHEEAVQPPHRRLQPREGRGGRRRLRRGALGRELGHRRRSHGIRVADPPRDQPLRVDGEVTAVRGDGVVGQAPLERDVPEVRLDRAPEVHVRPTRPRGAAPRPPRARPWPGCRFADAPRAPRRSRRPAARARRACRTLRAHARSR